jgi:transaldolase
MILFIDTGSTDEVEELAPWGVLSGATTNPSLLAADGREPEGTIRRIGELLDGPVSVEVVGDTADEMVAQGRALARIDDHVVVKLPFGPAALEATRALAEDGNPANMTLVFTAAQALMAAQAGASYVSCFLGRLEDIGEDALRALGDVIEALAGGDRRPLVLAASIRSPRHVVEAAKLGADIATIPAKVLMQMIAHPLTDAGIERFGADWSRDPKLARWLGDLTTIRAAA